MTIALPSEFVAVFQPESDFSDLRRYPSPDFAGLALVWGSRTGDQSFGLVQILADSGMWTADSFAEWLEREGYKPDEITEPVEVVSKQEPIELNEAVKVALRRKVEEHNEEHGDKPAKRATLRMLEASMRRGIGAYKTNPGSVRPTVSSPEQWAYARVNGLLHALRTGKFKRRAFDRDLLPAEHPMSSKQEKQSDDLFRVESEAVARAAEIGCVGVHVHNIDGVDFYMPCEDMADYEALTGLRHESSDELDLVPAESVASYKSARDAMAAASSLGSDGFFAAETPAGSIDFFPCSTMSEWERVTKQRAARSHEIHKAEWSSAYVSNLPDSAFFYIGDGGEIDDSGRTSPRYLRKLPYRNDRGSVDLPHLRNVLARLSQTEIPDTDKRRIREEARQLLEESRSEKTLTKAYEAIDFSPPKGVQEAAELGLALRREHGRGGTMVGVARARDLSGGDAVSPDTIRRMVSYFARHEVDMDVPANKDRSAPGYPGAGRIAWLLWGGDPGRRWAEKIRDQMNREDAERDQVAKLALDSFVVAHPVNKSLTSTDDLWKAPCPVLVSTKPDGEQFILAKTYQGNAVRSLDNESGAVDHQNSLWGVFAVMPDDCIIEGTVAKDRAFEATDLLYYQGRDLTGLSVVARKQMLGDVCGSLVQSASDVVSTPEDLVLHARIVADSGARSLKVQQHNAPYGAPVLELNLEAVRKDLWDYVPPRLNAGARAVFVTGSPNRMEAVRGQPLAGPDGLTFRKAYLDRMNLAMDEITVIHAQPATKSDNGDWSGWLADTLNRFAHLPFIALGKAASRALADHDHVKMPHPRAVRTQGDRGEVARKSRSVAKSLEEAKSSWCPIFKMDEERQIVYGVVLEPHTRDLQGDVLTIDTIEIAAHNYLATSRTVGDSHSGPAAAEVVESYLAPADYDLGGHRITKGTWVMGVHILDPELWESVKRGDFTGFSIGGSGERKELQNFSAQ